MDNAILNILIFLIITNTISFLTMVVDKSKSKRGKDRISEAALFFWAIFFGGAGIYFGMILLRHKTRKWYFYIGIPLAIIQNFCFLFLMYRIVEKLF